VTGLFVLTVLCAGLAVLQVLGLVRGSVLVGLAPTAGLAALVIFSSWGVLIGAPPPVASALVYGMAVLGLFLCIRDRESLREVLGVFGPGQRVPLATLAAALAIPSLAMGVAFGGAQVPLSPHDGASHAEAIQAFRAGQSWLGWYPPGMAALFATWLQPFPWVDSAQGAFELGLSLPVLASLTVFGLGMSIWHDARLAAAGAVLLSFTYLYPYFPQLWSGWPLALSLILVMGMWSISLEFFARPSPRWGGLGGLVVGAIVLVHGSELYTLAIVLSAVLFGSLHRIAWRGLGGSLVLVVGVALAGAGPYLPNLVGWAGAGGAYEVGLAASPTPQTMAIADDGPSAFLAFGLNALGIDLPIRLILVAIGCAWCYRQGAGRTAAAVGILFGGLAVVLNGMLDVPAVRQVYAVVFPWGMHYRLLMLVSIAQALLAGAGGVLLLRQVHRWTERPTAWSRRLRRLTRLLVITWLGLTTVALVVFMASPAREVLGFTADDAAAMAWLREHAGPSDVLVNDGSADAGIWAPYKAGVPILLPRTLLVPSEEIARRKLVWQNVASLDQSPEAAAAACAEHARYVYRGSKTSSWDERHFPPPETLRASPGLEEVFTQGNAIVFRIRLGCQ